MRRRKEKEISPTASTDELNQYIKTYGYGGRLKKKLVIQPPPQENNTSSADSPLSRIISKVIIF